MSAPRAIGGTGPEAAGVTNEIAASRRWVFITWYPYCRRSDALGEQLGAPSYLVHFLRFKTPWLAPFKYVLQTLKTLWILLRERPHGVLVASPPVVAPLVIWMGSLLLRYQFIIDAHSGAFQHARWNWALPLQRFLSRHAVATVVTNAPMAASVRSWGGRAEMVQDLALNLDPAGARVRRGDFHVVFICTYSVDEPVDAVVEAARRLPGVHFSFTGDPSYAPRTFRDHLPPNVHTTGFIPDTDYLALLRGADAILVLTLEDNTMQRGGYEAVSLEKPLITSHWQLLQEVFSRGTVHVDNSPEAIVKAVERIRRDPDTFMREMRSLRQSRAVVSATQVAGLRRLCQAPAGDGSEA
jgi:glycosyltransferase involved in cell wall biosynthesis